jgi:membrane protease YdiL (CAAX protease family)/uncharacterized RDD family membrane protein YckC
MNDFPAPAALDSRPVEYASFARRLGAALLDSLVWALGLAFLLGGISFAWLGLLILFLSIYFQFAEKRWGQTIGKNATGIRVVSLDGENPSLTATGMRNLLRLVDFPLALIGVDYLIVHGSERRQRLGDRAAKTIVVRERAEEPDPAGAGGAGDASALPAPTPKPTSAELFGDAAAALEAHPAAALQPSSAEEPAAVQITPSNAEPPRSSWSAAGFPYPRWEVKRTLLGLLAGLLIGGLFAPLLVLPFDPDFSSTGAMLAAQALLTVTLIAVALQVASGDRTKPVRADLALLGLRRFKAAAFGWLGLGLFTYYSVAIAYGTLITEPDQKDIARDLGLDSGIVAAVPAVFLIAVAAPIAEEIFFRGMLFGGLRRRLSTFPAAVISALVFGALHATTGVSAVPPLIVFGFVLALLYEKTGSLVPGMIAHALNNALALAVSS